MTMTMTMTTWGSLPAVQLTSADGATAIVTLFGAHLVSWTSADGAERLFCSARSARDGSRAIRGGVPVIFPQFAERGDGMRHGFARVATWRLADSGDGDGDGDGNGNGNGNHEQGAFAVFVLTDTDLAPALAQAWPHGFELRLTVAVQGQTLNLSLDVHNPGADEFAFSAALHTYYLVDAIGAVRIQGVEAGALRIADKLDRIYRDATAGITLTHGAGNLRLTQSGFRDVVIWNPGAADTATLADMHAADYQHFVCIEPALIVPASLAPGAAWRGEHQVTAKG